MRPELVQASELLHEQTPESVEAAIGLLQGMVFSFSMKMCGHREDAEDTAQDVLFSSLKHLHKLDTPESLAAWLFTVARNRCYRKRGKKNVSDNHHISLDELMPGKDELQFLLQDAHNTPEQDALQMEEQAFVHQAILHLPTALRLVLVLHDMEELDSEVVAHILDLKEVTVRVRLHRARLAVRQELMRMKRGLPEKVLPTRSREIRRSIKCSKIFAELSEYIDARMAPGNCDEMRAHMEKCPACIAFLADLKAAVDRCRSFSISCDPAVAERMRVMMTKEYLRLVGAHDSQNNGVHETAIKS